MDAKQIIIISIYLLICVIGVISLLTDLIFFSIGSSRRSYLRILTGDQAYFWVIFFSLLFTANLFIPLDP